MSHPIRAAAKSVAAITRQKSRPSCVKERTMALIIGPSNSAAGSAAVPKARETRLESTTRAAHWPGIGHERSQRENVLLLARVVLIRG